MASPDARIGGQRRTDTGQPCAMPTQPQLQPPAPGRSSRAPASHDVGLGPDEEMSPFQRGLCGGAASPGGQGSPFVAAGRAAEPDDAAATADAPLGSSPRARLARSPPATPAAGADDTQPQRDADGAAVQQPARGAGGKPPSLHASSGASGGRRKRVIPLKTVLRTTYEYHGLIDLFMFCITALAVTLVLYWHWGSCTAIFKATVQQSFQGYGNPDWQSQALTNVETMNDAVEYSMGWLEFWLNRAESMDWSNDVVRVGEYGDVQFARLLVNLDRNCDSFMTPSIECYRDWSVTKDLQKRTFGNKSYDNLLEWAGWKKVFLDNRESTNGEWWAYTIIAPKWHKTTATRSEHIGRLYNVTRASNLNWNGCDWLASGCKDNPCGNSSPQVPNMNWWQDLCKDPGVNSSSAAAHVRHQGATMPPAQPKQSVAWGRNATGQVQYFAADPTAAVPTPLDLKPFLGRYSYSIVLDVLAANAINGNDKWWVSRDRDRALFSMVLQRSDKTSNRPDRIMWQITTTVPVRTHFYNQPTDYERIILEALLLVCLACIIYIQIWQFRVCRMQHGTVKAWFGHYWNNYELLSTLVLVAWVIWYAVLAIQLFYSKEEWHFDNWDVEGEVAHSELRLVVAWSRLYSAWLYTGIVVDFLICLRLVRYMRIHRGLKAFYQVFIIAAREMLDFAIFVMYILMLLGSAVFAFFQLTGGNYQFVRLADGLSLMSRLTFGFLSYDEFQSQALGVGPAVSAVTLLFWVAVLLLVVYTQNIILAIVAEAYEEAKAKIGSADTSFLMLIIQRLIFFVLFVAYSIRVLCSDLWTVLVLGRRPGSCPAPRTLSGPPGGSCGGGPPGSGPPSAVGAHTGVSLRSASGGPLPVIRDGEVAAANGDAAAANGTGAPPAFSSSTRRGLRPSWAPSEGGNGGSFGPSALSAQASVVAVLEDVEVGLLEANALHNQRTRTRAFSRSSTSRHSAAVGVPSPGSGTDLQALPGEPAGAPHQLDGLTDLRQQQLQRALGSSRQPQHAPSAAATCRVHSSVGGDQLVLPGPSGQQSQVLHSWGERLAVAWEVLKCSSRRGWRMHMDNVVKPGDMDKGSDSWIAAWKRHHWLPWCVARTLPVRDLMNLYQDFASYKLSDGECTWNADRAGKMADTIAERVWERKLSFSAAACSARSTPDAGDAACEGGDGAGTKDAQPRISDASCGGGDAALLDCSSKAAAAAVRWKFAGLPPLLDDLYIEEDDLQRLFVVMSEMASKIKLFGQLWLGPFSTVDADCLAHLVKAISDVWGNDADEVGDDRVWRFMVPTGANAGDGPASASSLQPGLSSLPSSASSGEKSVRRGGGFIGNLNQKRREANPEHQQKLHWLIMTNTRLEAEVKTCTRTTNMGLKSLKDRQERLESQNRRVSGQLSDLQRLQQQVLDAQARQAAQLQQLQQAQYPAAHASPSPTSPGAGGALDGSLLVTRRFSASARLPASGGAGAQRGRHLLSLRWGGHHGAAAASADELPVGSPNARSSIGGSSAGGGGALADAAGNHSDYESPEEDDSGEAAPSAGRRAGLPATGALPSHAVLLGLQAQQDAMQAQLAAQQAAMGAQAEQMADLLQSQQRMMQLLQQLHGAR